jgi:hypothetical protein
MWRFRFLATLLPLLWGIPASAQFLPLGSGPIQSGGPVGPQIVHQTNSFFSGSCGSGCVVTIPSTSAGNALTIGVIAYGGVPTFTYSDTHSDTCTALTVGIAGGVSSPGGGIGGCVNISSGNTSVTVTSSSTVAFNIDVIEWSNVTASPFEQAQSTPSVAGSTITCTTAGATTVANDAIYLIGGGPNGSGYTSPTSPWAATASTFDFYQIGAALTSYSGAVTLTSATSMSCSIVAIKP